jgi:hypothetical protein
MLFGLVVRKLVYLQSILESSLSCLCVVIEIDKTGTLMTRRESLFDIPVCEIDN